MSTEPFDLRTMTVDHFLKATNCGYAEQPFIEFAKQYPTMWAVWDALAAGHGKPWWFMWLVTRPSLVSKSDLRTIICRIVLTIGDGKAPWPLKTGDKANRAVAVAERHAAGKASDEELDVAVATAGTALTDAWSIRAAINAAATAKSATGNNAWYSVWYDSMEQHRQFFASLPNPFILKQ